jgi:uncharacterized protein (DUF1697 family)
MERDVALLRAINVGRTGALAMRPDRDLRRSVVMAQPAAGSAA